MGLEIEIFPERQIGPFGLIPLAFPDVSQQKRQLPPLTPGLHFDELDHPIVGLISARNGTELDYFIPTGWIVDGLNQTRMVAEGAVVAHGHEIALRVVCVEKGRWGGFRASTDAGRAPLTIQLAAGAFTRNPENVQRTDFQGQVWSEVAKFETRGHQSPTSSLSQMMKEERLSIENSYLGARNLEEMVLEEGVNAFIIGLGGHALLAEAFPNATDVEEVLRQTLLGLTFETSPQSFQYTDSDEVQRMVNLLCENSQSHSDSDESSLVLTTDSLRARFQYWESQLCFSQILNVEHEFMKERNYV